MLFLTTAKAKFTPYQAMKVRRGSSGASLTSDTRCGVGGQLHAPDALTPGKRPGTHCIGGWVDRRVRLDGSQNLASTWIRSPDRPDLSESLYILRYRGPLYMKFNITCHSS